MRWRARHTRKALWHRWFAWRPVTAGEQTVWLEKVSYRQTRRVNGMVVEYMAGWN